MASPDTILVIKHGALGDMVLASGVMKAIRARHPHAHLILLTTKPYASLMQPSGWFDDIWIDPRPEWGDWRGWFAILRKLRSKRFSWVYDLQTSTRSSMYFYFFRFPKPFFSGIAKLASHRHHTLTRTSMHTIDRQAEQLRIAGIEAVFPPDISWMHGENLARLKPTSAYALLIPGGSAHRPEKRYPKEHYITLAALLLQRGMIPVLIGGGAEAELLRDIAAEVPQALNLCNQTSFGDIADLARTAALAIGNDTGPMHIIAATGCRSAVLFSHASNPALCAPRGDHVTILRREDLHTLSPDEILTTLTI